MIPLIFFSRLHYASFRKYYMCGLYVLTNKSLFSFWKERKTTETILREKHEKTEESSMTIRMNFRWTNEFPQGEVTLCNNNRHVTSWHHVTSFGCSVVFVHSKKICPLDILMTSDLKYNFLNYLFSYLFMRCLFLFTYY